MVEVGGAMGGAPIVAFSPVARVLSRGQPSVISQFPERAHDGPSRWAGSGARSCRSRGLAVTRDGQPRLVSQGANGAPAHTTHSADVDVRAPFGFFSFFLFIPFLLGGSAGACVGTVRVGTVRVSPQCFLTRPAMLIGIL